MREIEFRAFVKRKKEMFPVTDLRFNRYEKDAVGVSGCGDPYCTMCDDWYNFDDVLLMQYTGLKDKYGKKFFEGDICWDEHNDCYGVVKFEDAKFLYLWENIAEDLWEVADDIEICGNIHENPELLEGTE
ncbi:YopX family protein [Listeria monocytogenes]|uniref:YopX family protein n=1 Tax=Listeria monocytogenes TaxID=1639 RepID=UPI0024BE3464|nr:YopX family protein [Listeria monocytogenes]MDJ1554181.1 YopX family protein [Listeria monocytogenes]MDJ1557079.1 YopX family protein [Listeria monocytogenes]